MKTRPVVGWIGFSLMIMASVWSYAAAWLSANLIITVMLEFASYWLALVGALVGGYIHLRNMRQPMRPVSLFWRGLTVAFCLTVIVACWWSSNAKFALWKMKAIPPQAWVQMSADLETVGTEIAKGGSNFLPSSKAPPKSLQHLGSGADYSGTFGNVITSADYKGVTAGILFGYKGRSWGLCVGPESFAEKYSRGTNYIRVTTNGFFFAGPRD